MCPAAMGKIRCPLRPASMTPDRNRPEILTPPEHPPACCTQQTITVPPEVAPQTRQKHDYPSAAHRRSYARRTGAERTFSPSKDPATNNMREGKKRTDAIFGPFIDKYTIRQAELINKVAVHPLCVRRQRTR